jgi:hypothetical protein
LPKEIAGIPTLSSINVFANKLSGDLPRELGNLELLQKLDIERNQFSGSLFFNNFFDLADTLVELRASINNFTDKIPDMSEFKSLKKLWLANNTFTGEIHESITTLTGLGKAENVSTNLLIKSLLFHISSNHYPLSILHYICFDTEELKIQGNDFSGTIPSEIGNIKQLKEMFINGNPNIEGPLPSSIGKLENLAILNVADCGLSGEIPTEFGNLINLQYFVAFENNFGGVLPPLEKLDQLGKLPTAFCFH